MHDLELGVLISLCMTIRKIWWFALCHAPAASKSRYCSALTRGLGWKTPVITVEDARRFLPACQLKFGVGLLEIWHSRAVADAYHTQHLAIGMQLFQRAGLQCHFGLHTLSTCFDVGSTVARHCSLKGTSSASAGSNVTGSMPTMSILSTKQSYLEAQEHDPIESKVPPEAQWRHLQGGNGNACCLSSMAET